MGFFSKVRKRIKKLIPKEIRPFVPYIAAGMIGPGGLGALGQTSARFLTAAAARGLSDNEANLKDIARAGGLAALPSALSNYGDSANVGAKYAKTAGDYITKQGALKTGAAQGAVDMGIKAAELNEEALERYNREMAEQGINDKAGRRAAIRAIYSNTGTWDMDEVDSMLDTYGYRTGGRVGYAEGDMVLPMPGELTPERRNQIEGSQIAEQAYNEIMEKFNEKFPGLATGEETLEEMVAMLQAEDVMEYAPEMGILGLDRSMDMITPESAERSARRIMRGDTRFGSPEFNMGGRVGYKRGGFSDEEYENFMESFESAGEGLDKLKELDEEEEFLPIRELRLQDGGSVDDRLMERVKELQDEGLDFASALAQAMKEDMAANKARGGIMDGIDINMREQIDTPSGDMMMDENVEVASNPEVMDSLNELSLMLFRKPLDQLSDEEYDDLQDFAGQQALKPGLIDEYRNYKYNAEEQGQTPMSPRDYFEMEFGAARMGVARGGIMDVNTNMQLDIPDMGREDVDVNEEMLMAGGGARGEKAQELAQMLVDEKYPGSDFDFYDLSDDEQMKIYEIALDMVDTGGYKKGGKVIELMPKGILYKGKAKDYPGIKQLIKDMKKKGTRPKKAEGGLMSMGGNEMDLRGGGFVPMGAKERADDVPARLSKNEFVMTADAVRGAGGGSVQKGADLMYDQMKRLEGQA